MPVTAQTLIVDIRSRLDEISARFWTDQELLAWANEGVRDVSRRTETYELFTQNIMAVSGQARVPMPTDCLRIHRVEYQPTTSSTMPQVYPMELATQYELDQRWGSWQTQQRSYPGYACFWGRPPNLVMQVWPVPSQGGNYNLFYYGLPAPMASMTDIALVSEGWWDLVEDYCTSRALMKDRDPRWKDYKGAYEEGVANLVDVSRKHHDQGGVIIRGSGGGPLFPYGPSGDW